MRQVLGFRASMSVTGVGGLGAFSEGCVVCIVGVRSEKRSLLQRNPCSVNVFDRFGNVCERV